MMVQGFCLAGVTLPEQEHKCNTKICFAVPEKHLSQLASRLETALSKEELGMLHDRACPTPNVVDASKQCIGYDASRVVNRREQLCSEGAAGCSSAAPLVENPNPQHEAQRSNSQISHGPEAACGASGPGHAERAAEVSVQKTGKIDILAWYWGCRNGAKQSVPQLPRCTPFRAPSAPPRRGQQQSQAHNATASPGKRMRHNAQWGGETGNMPGKGARPGWSGVLTGDSKKHHHISDQGVPKHQQQHRPCGLERDHSALQGQGQHDRLSEQDGAELRRKKKKRRGGRLVRELAESQAAERDSQIELGFNANLKRFERSQRDKGVFQNLKKRSTVYTVSGALAHDRQ